MVRNGRIGQVKRVLAGVPKDPPPLTQNPAPMPVPPELNYEMRQGAAPARPDTEQRVHHPKAGLDYSGKGPGWMLNDGANRLLIRAHRAPWEMEG